MSKRKQAELSEEKDWKRIDDAVVGSERFIEKYQKQLLIGIGAVVVVVLGFLGYNNFIVKPKAEEAQAAIYKGQQYFGAGQDSVAVFGDGNGYVGFETIMDEYSSTKPGKLAKLYAGICYAQLGKYEDAVKYLDKFSAKDQLVSPAILGTIGNCYAEMGQLDKAAGTLLKAADKADSQALSPIYLIQAGQLFEKLGKNSEAVKAYTLVKEKYFNSYQSMDIDKYIERASIK